MTSNMPRPLSDLAFGLRMAVRNNPELMSILGRLNERPWNQRRVLRPTDDVLIDGFPRSANTFATYAFASAQSRPLRIGNHLHSPAQFRIAARHGIPALLVVRDPADAVASFMLYRADIDAREGLRRYIAFHRPLHRIRQAFVVAPFEEVIADFAVSIRRLNERFGTRFEPFRHTGEAAARILSAIESDRHRRFATEGGPPPRPGYSKAEAREAVLGAGTADLLAEARVQYREIIEPAS
jgi:hypothetical protein